MSRTSVPPAATKKSDVAATGAKNPVVFMEISIAKAPAGSIKIELFKDAVPKTAEEL